MEHPILFLDLLQGFFKTHIPPHVTYTWLIMLILVGLGIMASRRITLAVKSRSGSPAVTNGMKALRPEERRCRKRISMADMERDWGLKL